MSSGDLRQDLTLVAETNPPAVCLRFKKYIEGANIEDLQHTSHMPCTFNVLAHTTAAEYLFSAKSRYASLKGSSAPEMILP